MKTALVLGAGGFIGNHLVTRLKEENFFVRGVDLKYPEFSASHGIEAGNQISGMQLCDAAMTLLKQKPEEGWN